MIIGIAGRINGGKDTVAKMIQYIFEKDFNRKRGFDDPSQVTFKYWLSKSENNYKPHLYSWEVKKFAGKLKQIASILTGIPKEKFEDQEFKKTYLSREWNYGDFEDEIGPMTVRTFLQKLGTDAIRNGLHPDTWINAFYTDYLRTNTMTVKGTGTLKTIYMGKEWDGNNEDAFTYPNWLVSDTRFPNEAQSIKDRGGLVIRVNRNENAGKSIVDIMRPLSNHVNYGIPLPEVPYQTSEQLHPSETSLDNWNFDYEIDNNGTLQDLEKKVQEFLTTFNIIKTNELV